MMKNSLLLTVSCILFTVLSCSKQDIAEPEVPNPTGEEQTEARPAGEELVEITLEVEMEEAGEGDKATLSGGTISWEAGDAIGVYDGVALREFTVSNIIGTHAYFTGSVAAGHSAQYAVYPYSAASSTLPSGDAISIVFPATQTLASTATGSVAKEGLISVAKMGSNGRFYFQTVGALMKIRIPTSGITSVILTGNGSEAIAGNMTCVPGSAPSGASADMITLKPSGSTFTSGADYYIALRPTTFSKGFTLVYTTSTTYGQVISDRSVTFSRKSRTNYSSAIAGIASSILWRNTATYPYRITNATELAQFATGQGSYSTAGTGVAWLANDITLSSAWTPFVLKCRLNGKGKTISGLNVSHASRAGFISTLNSGAKLYNCTFSGTISLTGTGYAGCAAEVNGTIDNVTNNATVDLNTADVDGFLGGLAGYVNAGGTITNSSNRGTVRLRNSGYSSDASWVGGIAGYMSSTAGPISGCHNYGAVTCARNYGRGAGGIVGLVQGGGVSSCTNESTGSVTVSQSYQFASYAGGIAACLNNRSGNAIAISSCTNQGTITTNHYRIKYVGGIVGYIDQTQTGNADITNCINNHAITVSGSMCLNTSNGEGGVRALAGIVGCSSDTSNSYSNTLSGCQNTAAISLTGAYTDQAHQTFVAGIMGGGTRNVIVQNCTNTGAISSNWHSDNCVAGILGRAQGSTSVSGCTNSGTVTLNPAFNTNEIGQGGAAGIVAYYNSSGNVTNNKNLAAGTVTMALRSTSPSTQCGGIIALAEPTSSTIVSGNINRGAVTLSACHNQNAVGGVVGRVHKSVTISGNYNFGTITTKCVDASGNVTTPSDVWDFVYTGGVIGGFALSNATCTMNNNRNVGPIVAAGRAGAIFCSVQYDCATLTLNYSGNRCGDFTIKPNSSGTATTVTSSNIGTYEWSYIRSSSITDGSIVWNGTPATYITKAQAEAELN